MKQRKSSLNFDPPYLINLQDQQRNKEINAGATLKHKQFIKKLAREKSEERKLNDHSMQLYKQEKKK